MFTAVELVSSVIYYSKMLICFLLFKASFKMLRRKRSTILYDDEGNSVIYPYPQPGKVIKPIFSNSKNTDLVSELILEFFLEMLKFLPLQDTYKHLVKPVQSVRHHMSRPVRPVRPRHPIIWKYNYTGYNRGFWSPIYLI